MEYKRLTGQKWSDDIDLTRELGYSYIYKRLYELENKIENGTLIEGPCKVENPTEQKSRKTKKNIQQYKQPHCQHCEWYKGLTGTCISKLRSFGLKDRAKACGSRNCSSFKPLDEYKDCYKELQK